MTPDQFSLIRANLHSDGLRTRFDAVVRELDAALTAGQIANAAYTEAKFKIGRAIEGAWLTYINQHMPDGPAGRWASMSKTEQDIYFSARAGNAHELLQSARKFEKITASSPLIDAMRAFLEQSRPLAQAVADLKGLAVKRQVRTEEEREQERRFTPPVDWGPAGEAIRGELEAITQRQHAALIESLKREFSRDLDGFLKAHEAHVREGRSDRHAPPLLWPVTHLVERVPTPRQPGREPVRRYAAIAEPEPKIAAMAHKEADALREAFVYKNLSKLWSIVRDKGDFAGIDVLHESIYLRGLRGRLRVRFEDGAAFTAALQAVRSHSALGTPFLRYPLTFHDVVLSDGQPMRQPSEARMNDVFARAGDSSEEQQPAPAPRARPRG